MSPKEAYLSIKANKSRQDEERSLMASFVATLANVAGNGPKKPIKPKDLYKPQLIVKRKQHIEEPLSQEEAVELMNRLTQGK
jgi:hypothetical protein